MIRVRVPVLLACLIAVPQLADSAEFYVDPVHGDMSNDGSPGKPWRSIQAVFDQGLVESQQWIRLPYRDGAKLTPKNTGAPVRAGDTVQHGQELLRCQPQPR